MSKKSNFLYTIHIMIYKTEQDSLGIQFGYWLKYNTFMALQGYILCISINPLTFEIYFLTPPYEIAVLRPLAPFSCYFLRFSFPRLQRLPTPQGRGGGGGERPPPAKFFGDASLRPFSPFYMQFSSLFIPPAPVGVYSQTNMHF